MFNTCQTHIYIYVFYMFIFISDISVSFAFCILCLGISSCAHKVKASGWKMHWRNFSMAVLAPAFPHRSVQRVQSTLSQPISSLNNHLSYPIMITSLSSLESYGGIDAHPTSTTSIRRWHSSVPRHCGNWKTDTVECGVPKTMEFQSTLKYDESLNSWKLRSFKWKSRIIRI